MHRVMGERPLGRTDFSGPDACEMYANVVRARRFDDRALARQREGWLRGYQSVRGREAAQVGAAFAATPADALFPTRRSDALQLARDVPPAALLTFHRGGPAPVPSDASVFPRTSTGSGVPVAVGAAMARDHAGDDGASLAVLDARATSEGDFHEACNFAGVFETPCVFVCENDGRDPSHGARGTSGPTVAEMATAYGFEGVRVDGTDVLAVAEVVAAALADARDGSPVLVEAVVEGADHAGGDRERPDGSNGDAEPGRDPLVRLETYLEDAGVVDEAFATETREAADAELDRAVATAEASTAGHSDEMFEHAYADLPPKVHTQRSRARTVVDADESD